MGMAELRGKTPAMVERELPAYMVAHNLVRCVMAAAVAQHPVELERVSFQGSVDARRQFSAARGRARSRQQRRRRWADRLRILAGDLVPERPGRTEPRAVKRRPKPCPLLSKPRRKYKEVPHRTRDWKGHPRKTRGLTTGHSGLTPFLFGLAPTFGFRQPFATAGCRTAPKTRSASEKGNRGGDRLSPPSPQRSVKSED